MTKIYREGKHLKIHSIIKWKLLQDRVDRAMDYSNTELMSLGREIVDFHGEMILLENYSALNYTGLVKIIKKHDKRFGALLRLPFIQEVLNQPFFETYVLNSIVKECQMILNILFANNDEPTFPCSSTSEETEEGEDEDRCGSNVIEDENKEKLMQAPNELAEEKLMQAPKEKPALYSNFSINSHVQKYVQYTFFSLISSP
ncbi:unnamed protein product [Lathyrus sativus]|nr:unnamed protein product [Lathyrus sativus]